MRTVPAIGVSMLDVEVATEGGAEAVDAVVGEDVPACGQESLGHGVLLGHELHDRVRRKSREEARDHG